MKGGDVGRVPFKLGLQEGPWPAHPTQRLAQGTEQEEDGLGDSGQASGPGLAAHP